MADQNKIAEMLESLLNNEQSKAEELFHEYVVEKSREIYENLIDSEIDEASDEEVEEASDEEVEESSDDEDLEENFEEVEEGDEEDSDPTGKFINDVEDGEEEEGEEEEGEEEEGEEEGDDSEPATKGDVQDLSQEIQQLQAAFDSYMDGEANEPEHDDMGDMDGPDMGDMGMPKGMGDSIDAGVDQIQDLATVREYTEKIGGATYDKFAKGGDNGANTKSIVAGKNDMGGTTANIAKGGEGGGSDNGLLGKNTKDLGVNDPKAAAKGAFKSKVAAGHGAEKKGAGETGTNTASLFRGK